MIAGFVVLMIFMMAIGMGTISAWVGLDCYPWRRCGHCGMKEWKIFRLAPPNAPGEDAERYKVNQFAVEDLGHAMWLSDPQTEREFHQWLWRAYLRGMTDERERK